MLAAFMAGEDLHEATARFMLDLKNGVSPENRQLGKTANHALSYGQGWKGLQREVKADSGIILTDEEAKAKHKQFFRMRRGLDRWQQVQIHADCVESPLGRQWWDLPVKGAEYKKGSKQWNTRLNYPIQSGCAEGLVISLALLMREIPDNWRLVNEVHDSIMLEVPDADVARAAAMLKRCMIAGMRHVIKKVPVVVDFKTGKNWAELQDYDVPEEVTA